jgi:predicted component of type VI protein secretion system
MHFEEITTMQVVLVMFRADGERRSFSIVRDMTVVGRREDCDLRIPLGEVSRKHCRLIKDGEAIRIEDLGSSNGTFHNGERTREATLAAGDTIQIGPVTFMVQIDGVPADEDMQPSTGQPTAEAEVDEENADILANEELEPVITGGGGSAAPVPTDDLNFDAVSEKGPSDASEGSGSELDFDFDEEPSSEEPSSNDRPA